MRLITSLLVLALLAAACGDVSPGVEQSTEAAESDESDDASTEAGEVETGQGEEGGGGASGPTRPLELTPPGDTPPVDVSTASVPLEEIVFDTFDGSSVPLSEADDETINRLFDAIAPIDAPDYQSAAEADWLVDDELVIGYVDPTGRAWAYSARILNFREIVNDELGGQKVAVTYCPLCGSGIVYSRELEGTDREGGELEGGEVVFSNTSALYENDMVMVDRETGSYWWQVAGEALVGPLTGQKLEILPGQTTTWESWRTQYPDTSVMIRPDFGSFDRDPFANYGDVLDSGRTPFPVSPSVFEDDRLRPSARVVVVTVDGETKAWATEPARSIEDEVGGRPVLVETDGTGAAVTDADGNALPSRSLFWFSAVSAYPGVDLGR